MRFDKSWFAVETFFIPKQPIKRKMRHNFPIQFLPQTFSMNLKQIWAGFPFCEKFSPRRKENPITDLSKLWSGEMENARLVVKWQRCLHEIPHRYLNVGLKWKSVAWWSKQFRSEANPQKGKLTGKLFHVNGQLIKNVKSGHQKAAMKVKRRLEKDVNF